MDYSMGMALPSMLVLPTVTKFSQVGLDFGFSTLCTGKLVGAQWHIYIALESLPGEGGEGDEWEIKFIDIDAEALGLSVCVHIHLPSASVTTFSTGLPVPDEDQATFSDFPMLLAMAMKFTPDLDPLTSFLSAGMRYSMGMMLPSMLTSPTVPRFSWAGLNFSFIDEFGDKDQVEDNMEAVAEILYFRVDFLYTTFIAAPQ
ncbi:hypothetical protein OBBRIDRAFT_832913 [Obba rivulosa]|uniref:Uncharacterized protein n=1 Tax=Obba rivulosa TaxID=1052685 RepID=A0A8E2AXW5_9APHY|nr:hypothetical protein OBBRIDRAFT_832913 [Obba rivulosa]